jgi:MAC/Perforin domain-containing protein
MVWALQGAAILLVPATPGASTTTIPLETGEGLDVYVDDSTPDATYISARTVESVQAYPASTATYTISGTTPVVDGDTGPAVSWSGLTLVVPGGTTVPAVWCTLAPSSPTAHPPIPGGLLQYWTNGFDMNRLSFATSQIFAPTYTNASNVVSFGPQYSATLYSIPDHITYVPGSTSVSASSKQLIQTESDYNYTFTLGVQTTDKVPDISSVSDSSKFTYKGDILSNHEKAYNCDYYISTIGTSNINKAVELPLHPDFELAFRKILADAPAAGAAEWTTFFGTFGSNYLISAAYGGFTVITTTIDKTLVKTTNATSIQDDLNSAFTSTIGSDSTSVSTFDSFSTLKKENTSLVQTEEAVCGGTMQVSPSLFATSVYSNPNLLMGMPTAQGASAIPTPIFGTFADFVTDPTQQALIIAATADYVTAAPLSHSGLLDQPVASATDTAITVTSDRFVLIANTSNNDAVYLSDGTPSPTTTLAFVNGANSLLVPSRAGDTYLCNIDQLTSSQTPAPLVIETRTLTPPEGRTPALFGGWTSLGAMTPGSLTTPLPTEQTWSVAVPGQGFLLLSWHLPLVDYFESDDRVHPVPATVQVSLDGGKTAYAGAGVTYIFDGGRGAKNHTLALAVPIPATSVVDMTAICWIGGYSPFTVVDAVGWYLPLDTGVSFGAPIAYAWNDSYQVMADGLCVATGTTPWPGPYRWDQYGGVLNDPFLHTPLSLCIRTGTAATDVSGPQQVAATAATEVYYGTQTLVAPVPAGGWVCASSVGTMSAPGSTVWFVPITTTGV